MPPMSCRMSSSRSASVSARSEFPVYARITAYMVGTSFRFLDPESHPKTATLGERDVACATAPYARTLRLARSRPQRAPRGDREQEVEHEEPERDDAEHRRDPERAGD